MQNFSQPGRTIDVLPPYDLTSGAGCLVGSLFGVSATTVTVASGSLAEIVTEGVFNLAKKSTATWSKGDPIAWDDTNKRLDSDLTVGPVVATATADAANPSSTGFVKLNETSAKRISLVTPGTPAPTSDGTAAGITLTAAKLLTGVIVHDPGGNATDTLDTAAAIVAAVPGAKVGDMLRCYMVNGADAAETITLAAGAGGAFDANQTAASRVIPQNASKLLHIRLTNVTPSAEAYVVYA